MDFNNEYRRWLESDIVDEATKEELRAIEGDAKEIEGRFSKMLDFGTAGLRGIMCAGLFGMNVYTVRYATQGLADLIKRSPVEGKSGVTIAYDSRNNSDLFAREAAGVLAANGIHVYFFESLRPTPELSFALRETDSIAGINITASHNPKEYNGYKVYWEDGAQLPPQHAAEVAESMRKSDIFDDVRSMDFAKAQEAGFITVLGAETDEKYLACVLAQSASSTAVKEAADFKLIYTPLHGTGYKLVPEVLKRLGAENIITVPEQMVIDGDFPTVASPNPDNIGTFKLAIELAKEHDANLIIGTDPDGDRCGAVVRNGNEFIILTGNQLGVLLLDYLIQAKKEAGTLVANSAAVKSVVSTPMANAICEQNGVAMIEVLTGFKFIGEKIKEWESTNEHTFLFGFEESNGYLSGTYARDKDAIVASMLLCEMACYYARKGLTLYQVLQEMYQKYGFFKEEVVSILFEGFDASDKMAAVMKQLREEPPAEIGFAIERIRDYDSGVITETATGSTSPTGLPGSNMLFYELAGGSKAIVRPSGTEPKVKLYLMAQGADAASCDAALDTVKAALLKIVKG
ncbi:MAG: phospho-sugar mutase [Firmicutes bacterium]|nr:phospho-sugar mutase [Bacillota bacterium]